MSKCKTFPLVILSVTAINFLLAHGGGLMVGWQGRSYGYIQVEAPNYFSMHWWWNGDREAAGVSQAHFKQEIAEMRYKINRCFFFCKSMWKHVRTAHYAPGAVCTKHR